MGKYLNLGKEVLHVENDKQTHIADAGDTEMADFLTKAANNFSASREAAEAIMSDNEPASNFVTEALVTLSPAYHGELVAMAVFARRLDCAIEALQDLDEVKKSLFYGRDNTISPSLGHLGTSHLPHVISDNSQSSLTLRQATDFIHGAIGYATEAGEMLEALRSTISGASVDPVNVMEESGDGKWYLAILSRVFGWRWGEDESRVIAKLRKRFPDKFTEFDANNRNLAAERVVLEDGVDKVSGYYNETAHPTPYDIYEQRLPINHRTRPMEGERSLDGDALEAQKPQK